MGYRPLSNNERIRVNEVLFNVRHLNVGAADSLFMIYREMAKLKDCAEWDIFEETEKTRMENKVEYTKEENVFDEFDEITGSGNTNLNKLEWLFGSEEKLTTAERKLRILFFNSRRYRIQCLEFEIEIGLINDVDDFEHIENKLHEFIEKYPGTKSGVISLYELYFGDGIGLSYIASMERDQFIMSKEMRLKFLKERNLPLNWGLEDLKDYLKKMES